MNTTILNNIGLIFNIIGVILLFFYEPPKPETGVFLLEHADNEETRKRKKIIKRVFSNIALILIIIGFIIQLYANNI